MLWSVWDSACGALSDVDVKRTARQHKFLARGEGQPAIPCDCIYLSDKEADGEQISYLEGEVERLKGVIKAMRVTDSRTG